MNLLDATKDICNLHSIHPSRSKGQNFLINESVYDRIVAAAELSKNDAVLEVGPGLGFLTQKLAKAAGRVVAVELDDKLAAYLRHIFDTGDFKNVDVLNQDVLNLNVANCQLPIANYKIVANLPYNITSFFLRTVFTSWPKPSELVLLLQKEVVQRICARPGDMSLLALSIQFYSEVENLFNVPRRDFWPSPEVDSAVIRIRVRKEERSADIEKKVFQLAKIGFSAKRKMLKNNLAAGLHISTQEASAMVVGAGLSDKARAEDLAVEDWVRLSQGKE